MDIQKLLGELTVEEKAALVSGTDFMYTNPIPRLGIPAVCMSDGPHGLRKQKEGGDNGVSSSEPATAFPTATATASGWNPENTRRMGRAIGEECRYYGVHILLGPGANIKRNPRAGRNFEYFSEDPLLAGTMGAAEVEGVQSTGVGVSLKHFALNNTEEYRFMGDSVCDTRAMREIYLKVFEHIVRQAHPATVMCAYNKINGTYCSENPLLLTDILRHEWGFDGAVMTDWGATHDRVAGLKAGLDLEMPGDCAICRKWILDAVSDGSLPMEVLDTAVANILRLAACASETEKTETPDFEAHHRLAAEIAEDCAVLMKNDGVLPLAPDGAYLVVGDLFEKMRYQGAGSSMIHPTAVTTPKDAFDARGVHYGFARGYRENRFDIQPDLIDEAVRLSAGYETVLIFAGLTDYAESEGADRETLSLPHNQLALIDALVETGKKIVVVLFGGSVVELPFADRVHAILNMFLPGQNGGTATARLLFGEKNPAGRLSETWVKCEADIPFDADYSKQKTEVYKESVFVGYRYYLTANKEVRYPFGYGLSYTTFAYHDIEVEKTEGRYTVKCRVENTGDYDGAEVVELYVKPPKTEIFKPEKELRAFGKVYLASGESRTVTLSFAEEDLRIYYDRESRWVLEAGTYEIQICSDCETVRLSEPVTVAGETIACPWDESVREVYGSADMGRVTDALWEKMSGRKIPAPTPARPVTLESRFTDMRETLPGRILFSAVLGVAKRQMKRAQKMPDGVEKDNAVKGALFLKRILESNSLISMSMSAGKSMPYHFARGFVEFANWHILRAIGCFLGKPKVPKLPKEINKEER